MNPIHLLAALGVFIRQMLADWGFAARLFFRLVGLSGVALKRFGLVRDQVHFLGNYSLAIITVSGLFVGFVLGLQGYYTLQRFGARARTGGGGFVVCRACRCFPHGRDRSYACR
jgi:phospholipid/cholesterol/gamma-HCH transport system permease protein